MKIRILLVPVVVLAGLVTLSGSSVAAPSTENLDKYAAAAIKQKLIDRSDSGKVKRIARETCKNAALAPPVYWPTVSASGLASQRAFADPELKVTKKVFAQLVQLATTVACPRSKVILDVPTGGWQIVRPDKFFTSFEARVTPGALLPLGNAWQLGGELTGYVVSGKWYEGAYFKIEMLDANLQPVTPNFVGLMPSDGRDTVIDPGRPAFDNPILQKPDWVGGYSPGQDYSPVGSGSDSEQLARWANAHFARVVSLTGTDSALVVLRADPERWILSN